MNNEPVDRSEYIIRFVFAFIVFGVFNAFILLRFMNSISSSFIGILLALTTVMSLYAARVGDDAWHRLVNFFRWW